MELFNLTVSNTETGISILWEVVAGALFYAVYRRPPYGAWACIHQTADGLTTEYEDGTAVAGQNYEYMVRAVFDENFNENIVSMVYKTAPSHFKLSLRNAAIGIECNWDVVDGAEFYVVYRREKLPGTTWEYVFDSPRPGLTTCIDRNVLPDKTYEYIVLAGDLTGTIFTATSPMNDIFEWDDLSEFKKLFEFKKIRKEKLIIGG